MNRRFAIVALLAVVTGTFATVGVSRADGKAVEAAEQVGYLSLQSTPPAKVLLDGIDKGSTPLVRVPVPARAYKVTLVTLDGKQTKSVNVRIIAGEETKLRIHFDS